MIWCRRAARSLVTPWMVGFAALVAGYTLFFRLTLPDQGRTFGAAEMLGLIASNPYYLLYVVVPVWLLIAVFSVRAEADFHVLIRDRSRSRWLRRFLLDTSTRLVPGLLVLTTTWVLGAIGLAPTSTWVMFQEQPNATYFSAALGPSGLSPLGLAGAQVLSLASAGIAGAATLATVYALTLRAGLVAVVAVILFMGPLIGHVLAFNPSGPLAVTSLENYVSPLSSQTSFGAWWIGSAFCAIWVAVLALLLHVRDSQRATIQATPDLAYAASAAFGAALLFAGVLMFPQARTELPGAMLFLFQGATPGGSSLVLYLITTILFLAPAFLFAAEFEARLDGLVHYELVRRGSFRRFIASQLLRNTGRNALALVGAACSAVVAWAVAPASRGKSILSADHWVLVYQYSVNGMLQLTFYALLVLLVIWITGRAHSALLALGAVFVVGFFPLASVPVLPAYVNSLSYAVGGWHPVLTGTAVLVVSIVVTLATIFIYTRRRGLTV